MAAYVTGKKGRYEIQVPIKHSAHCPCKKCVALPIDKRGEAHVHRVRRK